MEFGKIQQQRIEDLISRVRWQNAVFTSLKGDFYRTVSYRYSRQPLSTRGAELTGGRYNFRPPNGTSFSCLYCGELDFTASTEKFYNLKTQNAPLPPHTVVCLKVQLQRVLDLTSIDKCESANIDWYELNQPWEYYQDLLNIPAYTQRIGAIAYEQATIEVILFTSTKVANTINIAIFPERLLPQSSLSIYDPPWRTSGIVQSRNWR